MGKITASIKARLESISNGSSLLRYLLDEVDLDIERPELANDLYDIDAQIWGLIRDIENYIGQCNAKRKGG